jgi:hypothetical protein
MSAGDLKDDGRSEWRRHHYHDSSYWRSVGCLCGVLSIVVYGIFAFLPRAGSEVREHQANPVGRNSSLGYSDSHGRGSSLPYREEFRLDRVRSDLSIVRDRVRVHDRASRYQRVTVQPGNTLYGLSRHYWGNGYLWPGLCRYNRIRDCNLIYPGQVVTMAGGSSRYVQRQTSETAATYRTRAPRPHKTAKVPVEARGHYSCAALERLWDAAGGSPRASFIAAEIATAESGGNPRAISPTDDFGLWQINGSHGALATLSPWGNAKAAIIISGNGTNWHPWTTYNTGAYIGQC